jgi:hypothetical protein
MRKKAMRSILVLLALWGLLTISGCTDPHNPEAEADAVEAAEAWLALVDAGAYADSWEASDAYLRNAVTKEEWVQTLGSVRDPMGANTSRRVQETKYRTYLPQTKEGEYVVAKLLGKFEKLALATEVITLVKGEDGIWRVAGYNLKSGRSHWLDDMFKKKK